MCTAVSHLLSQLVHCIPIHPCDALSHLPVEIALPHMTLQPHKEPFKAELKQTCYARASNSLRGYLCSEGGQVLLISRAYDNPLCQPSHWSGYKSHIHTGRNLIEAQPLGRLEVNKDICPTIEKLLKQLDAIKQLFCDQNTAVRMTVNTLTETGQNRPIDMSILWFFILRKETTALAP